MFKWQKQEHTDIFIKRKLDAKEKGDTQKIQIPSIKFSKNIEGKVDSYLSWNKLIRFFKIIYGQ